MIIDLPSSPKLVPISELELLVSPEIYQSIVILLNDGFGQATKMTFLPVQLYFILKQGCTVCTCSVTDNLSAIPQEYIVPNSKLIFNLTTLSSFRGRGLGTQMLNWVVFNCFQDPKCIRIYLEVEENNVTAYRIYLNFGFVKVNQVGNRILLQLEKQKFWV